MPATAQVATADDSTALLETPLPGYAEQQGNLMSDIAAPDQQRKAKKSKEELERAWQARKESALKKTGLLKLLNPRALAYVPLNQTQSQPGASAGMPSLAATEHSADDQTADAADHLLAQLMGSSASADRVICIGEANCIG